MMILTEITNGNARYILMIKTHLMILTEIINGNADFDLTIPYDGNRGLGASAAKEGESQSGRWSKKKTSM